MTGSGGTTLFDIAAVSVQPATHAIAFRVPSGTLASVPDRQRARHRSAEALAWAAVEIAESTEFVLVHANALLDLGEVLRRAGREEEVLPFVEAARRIFERMVRSGAACAHANRRKLSIMRVGASAMLCAIALVTSFASSVAAGASSPSRTLRNDRVGYSLSYPRGWKVVGQVVATEFAVEAACQSVRVVDFAPPATVPSGQILQSFVQICWKRVRDGSSLEQFMRKTYGRRLTELFRRTTLGATLAYRARDEAEGRMIFLQTSAYRLQIVAAAVARAPRREKRLAQVERILASLSVTR